MIHYQLRCAEAHEFDGWFKNSTAFEEQAGNELIACPTCGDTTITRALMSPNIPRKGRAEPTDPDATPAPTTPAAGGVIPDAVRAALQTLRSEVENHCDYVGPQFATEARRIHNGEATARGIYGESTDEEAESLADDGIAFARIPWLPRSDS
jgi:hypothetical protein